MDNQLLSALKIIRIELESWNSVNSPSETGYVVEDVPAGHSLHTAFAELQRHGTLHRLVVRHWRKFLKFARSGDEDAEDEAEWLLEWVNGEIERHELRQQVKRR